jgi:hypothetical protein
MLVKFEENNDNTSNKVLNTDDTPSIENVEKEIIVESENLEPIAEPESNTEIVSTDSQEDNGTPKIRRLTYKTNNE